MTDQRLAELKIDRDRPPARSGRGWLIGLFAVTALAAGAFFFFAQRPRGPEVETTVVRAATAGRGSASVLDGSGYVTARRQATVSSKVTGKVVEIFVEEGMRVKAGQLLARLDDSLYRHSLDLAVADLATAESALAETRAQLTEAELSLGRARKVAAEGFASQAEVDAAVAARDTFAARLVRQERQVESAEVMVDLRRQELADTEIRAPFSGVATSKNAQPGEMISPISAGGGFTRTGICTLVDMASLEIEVDVNEAYIQRVRDGQRVVAVLDAYPDWQIPAHVITIVPTADRQKATVRVRIGFEELEPRILPDMGVKVSFAGDESDSGQEAPAGVLIPAAALARRDGREVVFVARDGRVEERAVASERSTGTELRIPTGLAAGETVVLSPPDDLADGDAIQEDNR